MKFGRNLPRNQVPEWASSYIKYKKLKKLIKSAVEDAKNGRGVDTAGKIHSCFLFLHEFSIILARILLFP